jgi:hypothetical protein
MDTTNYPESRLFAPIPGATYEPGDIVISGRAESADFDHYIVEWGDGASPTAWSTVGVVLAGGGTAQVENGTLATINFPDNGTYSIRLTTYD